MCPAPQDALSFPVAEARGMPRLLLKQTAQSNIEEIQFEPTVRKRAANRQVRAFGRRMWQDHTRAEVDLRRLAVSVHDTLPTDPSKDQKAIMKRLEIGRASGRERV